MIDCLAKVLAAVERVSTVIAGLLLFAIMIIVTGDVFFRYALNSPFVWAYDLIALYLMAGLFFFVLSAAHGARAHVGVDIFYRSFPPRLRWSADIVTSLTALAVFCLIAWIGWGRFVDAFAAGAAVAGHIPWPTWLSYVLVPLGCGMIALRLVLHIAVAATALATGREPAWHGPTVDLGTGE